MYISHWISARLPRIALAGIVICLHAGMLIGADHSAILPVPRDGSAGQRFESINQKVKEARGEVDLVFIGDSITQGWEGQGRSTWDYYYGNRRALNLGIGGDRTQHVLWRMEHGNLEGINPRLAVVMIGTNNSGDDRNTAEEIMDGIRAVVSQLRSRLPETEILLLGIFPRGREVNAQRGKINQVNQVIRRMADGDTHVHWMDIGHHFLDDQGHIPSTIMPDGLHLSELGYEIWAQSIEGRLARLLGDTRRPQRPGNLDGQWTWSMMGPNDQLVSATMSLKVTGFQVQGEIAFDQDRRYPLNESYCAGPFVGFSITRQRPNGTSITYQLSGSRDGNTIHGKAQAELEGQSITSEWKASR